MSGSYRQVRRGVWPSGIDKPIAVLRADPETLAKTYDLKFTRGKDELDEFAQAAIKLKSGRPVLFTRYRRSPEPGTTVSIDDGDHANDALEELAIALGLRPRAVAWVSEEVDNVPSLARGGLSGAVAGAVSTLMALGTKLRSEGNPAYRVKRG